MQQRAWAWTIPILVHATAALASPPAVPQVTVEEALRQAARISWSSADSDASTRFRLQRRIRGADQQWGDWADIVPGDTQSPYYAIDLGLHSNGLAPGDYSYRVQAGTGAGAGTAEWSEWSSPADFSMTPQCAGGNNPPGNEKPGALQTVVITDLDGNGRYTGADVWLAIERCSELGGCVLEGLPVTYDDVAISLYGKGAPPPCTVWDALVCEPLPPLPKGLVIQGHGSATVFRSPLWNPPYKPSPIFEFWHTPGVQLRFRNFVLDGRKGEQRDPSPGKNEAVSWRHRGIDITHYFAYGNDHTPRYPDGCIHNVTARDFLLSAFMADHLRNWRIEYNQIQDMGCWKRLTECPLLTIPEFSPPPAWGCAGYQVPGYGIEIGGFSDDTHLAYNRLTRVTKYALGVKGGPNGSDPITRLHLHDNHISNIGTVGLFLAGLDEGVVERNLIEGTHGYGCREGGWANWAIQTNGLLRKTMIRDNTLRNLAGIGIGSNARVERLAFVNNVIDNVCVERNVRTGNKLGAIHLGDGSAGSFNFTGNRVTNNHCSMAFAACWGSQAQVVVDGGYYSTAENSDPDFGALFVESGNSPKAPKVLLKNGVKLEYLGREWRPGVVANGNARIVVADDSVQVNKYREAFTAVRSCLDQCAVRKTGTIVRCAADPANPECP